MEFFDARKVVFQSKVDSYGDRQAGMPVSIPRNRPWSGGMQDSFKSAFR